MSNNEKLQGTPDWSTAPEWANYWAVDANGDAFWYEYKPWKLFNINAWIEIRIGGNLGYFGLVTNIGNWENSLQKRP